MKKLLSILALIVLIGCQNDSLNVFIANNPHPIIVKQNQENKDTRYRAITLIAANGLVYHMDCTLISLPDTIK